MRPTVAERRSKKQDPVGPFPLVIPRGATTLAGFRAWSQADDFPREGVITFLNGEIWLDMSPERLLSHNRIKTEETRILATLAVSDNLGDFYSDRTRLVNKGADLSTEPDGLFVTWATLQSGKVRLVPTKDGQDFIELEGTPDWVSEIISPSSEKKDADKLLHAYHKAEIPEYWLIDARRSHIDFQPLVWRPAGYEPVAAKAGWYASPVFGKAFRWRRHKNVIGQWAYLLEMR
ncbi:MAG: Uma2 family endonuclease [Gemmataceae bacterium]